MKPIEGTLGERLQHSSAWFTDASGQFSVGVWDTTAYRRKPMTSACHEWMHIVEGSVTLTDAEGQAHCFVAGDFSSAAWNSLRLAMRWVSENALLPLPTEGRRGERGGR